MSDDLKYNEENLRYIRDKVDAIHTDLREYHGRISVIEESLTWVRGHINIVTLVVLAIIGALLKTFIK